MTPQQRDEWERAKDIAKARQMNQDRLDKLQEKYLKQVEDELQARHNKANRIVGGIVCAVLLIAIAWMAWLWLSGSTDYIRQP